MNIPKGHGGPTSITLQPGNHAGRAARRFVRYAAAQWLGPAKLDQVLSVVSELVDNAAVHAHTPMVLNLSPGDAAGSVRIELYDGSTLPPTPADARTADEVPVNGMSGNDVSVDSLSTHAMSASAMSADQLSADQLSADQLSADQLSADQMSIDEVPVGLGLRIVQRMAVRWGVDVHPDGKMVWAEL